MSRAEEEETAFAIQSELLALRKSHLELSHQLETANEEIRGLSLRLQENVRSNYSQFSYSEEQNIRVQFNHRLKIHGIDFKRNIRLPCIFQTHMHTMQQQDNSIDAVSRYSYQTLFITRVLISWLVYFRFYVT